MRIILRPKSGAEVIAFAKLFPGLGAALEKAYQRRDIPIAPTDQDNVDLAESVPGSLAAASYTQIKMENRNVRIVALDGVEPTVESFERGAYPYCRTLHFIAPAAPSPAAALPRVRALAARHPGSPRRRHACWARAEARAMRSIPFAAWSACSASLSRSPRPSCSPSARPGRLFKEAEALSFKAGLSSERAAKFIYSNGTLWQYQHCAWKPPLSCPGLDWTGSCSASSMPQANGSC